MIYNLGNEFRRGALHVDREIPPGADTDGLLLGTAPVDAPVRFVHDSGTRAYDLVGCTDASTKLVSPRLVRALTEAGTTGWQLFPTVVRLRDGSETSEYGGLRVVGRSGPVNYAAMRPESRPPLFAGAPERKVWVGLEVDEATIDGSDVFVPAGSRFVLLSERARNALAGAGLKNVSLKLFAELEFAAPIRRD